MISYQKDYEEIINLFNKKLLMYNYENPEVVWAYLTYRKINGASITSEERKALQVETSKRLKMDKKSSLRIINKRLEDIIKSSKIFELIESFETELKNYVVKNNILFQHVTGINPQDSYYTIKPSRNLTMYKENEVNGVFASTNEINKLLFATRVYNKGLVRIGKKSYVLPVNSNLIIDKSLTLKVPVFCYYLEAKNFRPVVTISYEQKLPKFVFEDEWVSQKTENAVKVERIQDVTELLDEITLYLPSGRDLTKNLELIEEIRKRNRPTTYIKSAIVHHSLICVNDEVNYLQNRLTSNYNKNA